ncbi:DUF4253 domain-containing protein [Streptomyces sp. NPDC058691]|uniref:DUF4253 domain-containing protein n=1 Tax=Streptomyces sp. NPDC058691 TaxID=3346601 RepID=UPI0036666BD7
MHERTADRILGESWERYAQEEIAHAGEGHPGRDEVVETFGEPARFEEVVFPFGTQWPGLAAAPAGPWADAGQLAERALAGLMEQADDEADDDDEGEREMALLERAYRGADLPALAEERGLEGCWPFDMAEMCTVLRSWEERFGIRLIGLEDDRVTVSVAAPVTTMAEAEAIAAEHFAFAPDNITQGWDETLGAYAANQILGKQVWSFWWD